MHPKHRTLLEDIRLRAQKCQNGLPGGFVCDRPHTGPHIGHPNALDGIRLRYVSEPRFRSAHFHPMSTPRSDVGPVTAARARRARRACLGAQKPHTRHSAAHRTRSLRPNRLVCEHDGSIKRRRRRMLGRPRCLNRPRCPVSGPTRPQCRHHGARGLRHGFVQSSRADRT